jgi:hypothetical protein
VSARASRPRFVVVALQEDGPALPVVVGAYLDRGGEAAAEAARWNGPDSGYTATVVPLETGPSARRAREVPR